MLHYIFSTDSSDGHTSETGSPIPVEKQRVLSPANDTGGLDGDTEVPTKAAEFTTANQNKGQKIPNHESSDSAIKPAQEGKFLSKNNLCVLQYEVHTNHSFFITW